jgi:hypothetical protein
MNLTLDCVVEKFADAVVAIDSSGIAFRSFSPGVGPYGEPQLLSQVARHLNAALPCGGRICTKRTPDLLIPDQWAVECKIARPFGDNGKPAENWSVNLLHPYPGNTSLLGDCLKLQSLGGVTRKAVIVVGYEHQPPQISLLPLLLAFEVLAKDVLGVRLSARMQEIRSGLMHPIHQQVTVAAWEIL